MWRIIIVAVLLGAVAGNKTPSNNAFVKPVEKTKEDSHITTTAITLVNSSASPSPSTTTTTQSTTRTSLPETSSSSKPTTSPSPQAASEIPSQQSNPELPPAFMPIDDNDNDNDNNMEPNKRRIITYDQRQEGQYNIRADLENFMIVLIPPSPMEGLSLLDLLTKSSLRRSAATHSNKAKRRHPYADVAAAQTASAATRFHQSLKTGNNNQNFNNFNRAEAAGKGVNAPETAHRRYHQQQQHQHQQQPVDDSPHSSSTRFQEFIEGRTPYIVDLSSSSNGEHTRLHPDRQVDVLPPPYPLAYQHLITPFHLEAEPTVIQTLPPSSIAGQSSQGASNFLETYNQLLAATSLQESNDDAANAHAKTPQESDFYRVSRAIRADNLLDTNGVTLSNSLLSGSPDASMYRRSSNLPIFRSDLSFGTAALYPPIDAPRLTGYLNVGSNSRTLSLNSAEDRDLDEAHVGEIIVPSSNGDELDFDLNSASFIDSDAKSLLSDGLERCAPGRRRDSYGVCREIKGY